MKRIIKYFLLPLSCFCVALIIAIPPLLSLGPIHQFLVEKVNQRIPGKISLDAFSISWFSGIQIQGAKVLDPKGRNVASCNEIVLTKPLLSFLYSPTKLGKIMVAKPYLLLVDEEGKGTYSIEESFSSPQHEKHAKSHKPKEKEEPAKSKPPEISASIDIKDGDIQYQDHTQVSHISLSLNIEEGKNASLDFSCEVPKTESEAAVGSIMLHAKTNDLQKAAGSYKTAIKDFLEQSTTSQPETTDVELDCKISHFPITIVDAFLQLGGLQAKGLATQAIGPKLDAEFHHLLKNNKFSFSGEIKSRYIYTKDSSLVWEVQPELANLFPDFTYKLQEPAIFRASQNPKKPLFFTCTTDAPILLKNDDTELSLRPLVTLFSDKPAEAIHFETAVDMQAGGKSATFDLSAVGATLFVAPKVSFTTKAKGEWPAVISAITNKSQNLQELLGPSLEFELTGDAKQQGDALQASGGFSFQSEGATAEASYLFAKDILSVPLLRCVSKKPPKALLELLGREPSLEVKDLKLNTKTLSLNAKVQGLAQGKSDFVSCDISAKKQPSGNLLFAVKGNMPAFQTKYLGALLEKPEISKLLGDQLSCEFSLGADSALTKKFENSISLHGEGIELALNFTLGKEVATSSKGSFLLLKYKVTPERFSALRIAKNPKTMLLLSSPFTVHLECPELAFSLQEPAFPKLLDTLSTKATLALSEIECIEDKTKNILRLSPLSGEISVDGAHRTIVFDLKNKKDKKPSAEISITGFAKNLWNSEKLQLDKASISLKTDIKDFPLEILQDSQISAIAGKKVNAKIDASVDELKTGKLEGTVNSPFLHSSFSMSLSEGQLRLVKPLIVEYELTKQAGEALLKGVNPLLASGAHSKTPITFYVDPKGFQIPLSPFSLKDAKVDMVKIDPGRLTVKNGGLIAALVTLLEAKHASRRDEVSLWLTPIYVDVNKGLVTCKRADALLADSFPIATWGTLDLLKDKIHMTLGLSSEALRRGFGISNLNPEYLLQIPISGSLQSPKIDTTRATAKITAMKMQTKSNPTTAILGGLLEVAATAGEKEKAPPPPTTYPFPWQQQRKAA